MKKTAQTVIREGACYTIAAANGRVLEVADFNTENGASVRLWSYEGQPWQQWFFEEAADGQYRIKNRFTGKVMDLAMSGVANGTWIHQPVPDKLLEKDMPRPEPKKEAVKSTRTQPGTASRAKKTAGKGARRTTRG